MMPFKSFDFSWLAVACLAVCLSCAMEIPKGADNSSQPDSNNDADTPAPPAPSTPGNPSFGLTQRTPFTGSNFPMGLAEPAPLTISDAFPGLSISPVTGRSFVQPLHMSESPDGTNRFFLVLKDGRIQYFTNAPNTSASVNFLNLSGRVSEVSGTPLRTDYSPNQIVLNDESGLLGMAFDPNFASNGYYYVYYVTNTGGALRSVVSQFQASANRMSTLAGSEKILLQIPHTTYVHKAGTLAVGPDNMLYIASGDGQVSPNGQTLSTLRGKILRIEPPRASAAYSIPNDNPFTDAAVYPTGTACASGDAAAGTICREIWAYGLRNPWRMSFDRNTGDLWVGDVGEADWEEINRITRGGNYGWPRYEGNLVIPNALFNNTRPHSPAVFAYPRTGATFAGITVLGGMVYRGSQMPSLYGKYVFMDHGTRNIWAFTYMGSTIAQTDITNLFTGSNGAIAAQPVAMVEDLDGEIYIIQLSRAPPSAAVELYRIAEAPGTPTAPAIPPLLSQTGLFSNAANLAPAAGLIEYDVNSPLWSDGAAKKRWLALPGTQQITFSATGNWTFPLGTILVKHFELPQKRLETRVLINDTSGWQGYTYKWNAAQTDADLLSGPVSENVGGQSWDYPSRAQCRICHTLEKGSVLGVRAHQLNGDFAYPSMTDNQLRAWNHIGLFTSDIGDAGQYNALSNIHDASASLSQRAKSYFESNCSQCHQSEGPGQPSGTAPVDIDFRFETQVSQMQLVNENAAPLQSGSETLDTRVVPGSKETSVLWERMRRRFKTDGTPDSARMPPLGTTVADPDAVNVIGEWIDAGAP